MNTTIRKKDSEILKELLHKLRINAKKLSEELGYKSHMSVYHILKEKNNLSEDMINRILKKYPNVNYVYLKTGEGELFKNVTTKDIQVEKNNPSTLEELFEIPERLKRIEEILIEIQSKL